LRANNRPLRPVRQVLIGANLLDKFVENSYWVLNIDNKFQKNHDYEEIAKPVGAPLTSAAFNGLS